MKKFGLPIFHVLMSIMIVVPCLQNGFAQEWTFESQRVQISPRSYMDTQVTFQNKQTLGLAGGGKEYADGHWSKTVEVVAGQYYQFKTFFKAVNVEEPGRCIQGRIIWLDNAGEQVGFTEYPVTASTKSPEGWNIMEKFYQVPSPATKAKLELHYRWDADGAVNFTKATFEKTVPPESRKVKLATVFHRPRNSKS